LTNIVPMGIAVLFHWHCLPDGDARSAARRVLVSDTATCVKAPQVGVEPGIS
jgi:hypothetical protein